MFASVSKECRQTGTLNVFLECRERELGVKKNGSAPFFTTARRLKLGVSGRDVLQFSFIKI